MKPKRAKVTPPELKSAVDDALANISTGVQAYVFNAQHAQYRTVAGTLRTLVLDKNSASSFNGKGSNRSMFELVYGRADKIFLQSLLPKGGIASKDGYIADGPPLWDNPIGILQEAGRNGRTVSLREWLEECAVHDANGSVRKTRNVLLDIADKEGAHAIFGWGGKDWRGKAGITFANRNPQEMTLDEVAALPYDLNWQQFVIGAGARLLYARRREGGGLRKLFDTRAFDIAIARSPVAGTITLERKI